MLKKSLIISVLAITGVTMFVFAEQPTPTVSDSAKYFQDYRYNEDSTRIDTIRQTTIHINKTVTNNLKGD